MGRVSLRDRIKQGLFILDGAMGTQLIARRIEVGRCNDYLSIDSPDVVSDIHQAYLQAGSNAILTNTFGANRYALARHGLDQEVITINTAAAKIARQAAGDDKYVLGDIGPSGDFLQPVGSLTKGQLKEAFTEQAKALADGQVDGFIIETMTALDETIIAVEAAKLVCDLPIFVSLAYGPTADGFKTMMGVSPADAIEKLLPLGIDAIGFNCGDLSLAQYAELAEVHVSAIEALGKTRATSDERQVTILAEPNAGKPELLDDKTVYKVSADEFAKAAEKIHTAGINIIGGCCGTGPQHIKALAQRLKK